MIKKRRTNPASVKMFIPHDVRTSLFPTNYILVASQGTSMKNNACTPSPYTVSPQKISATQTLSVLPPA